MYNKNMLLILSSILITLQIGSLEAMESITINMITNNIGPSIPNTLHKSSLKTWDVLINEVQDPYAINEFVSLLKNTKYNIDNIYSEDFLDSFQDYTINDKNLMRKILFNTRVIELVLENSNNKVFLNENKSFKQFVDSIIKNEDTDNNAILQKQEHMNNFIILLENPGLLYYFLCQHGNTKDEYHNFIDLLQNEYVKEILLTRDLKTIRKNMANVLKALEGNNDNMFADKNFQQDILQKLEMIANEQDKKQIKNNNAYKTSKTYKQSSNQTLHNKISKFVQSLEEQNSLMNYFKNNNNEQEYYKFINVLEKEKVKIALRKYPNREKIIDNIINIIQSLDENNVYKIMQEEIVKELVEY